jgi:hypothetical protein
MAGRERCPVIVLRSPPTGVRRRHSGVPAVSASGSRSSVPSRAATAFYGGDSLVEPLDEISGAGMVPGIAQKAGDLVVQGLVVGVDADRSL